MCATPSGGGSVSPHSRFRTLLIVDADPAYRELLQQVAGNDVHAEVLGDFQAAYARLWIEPPDLLVTNLRLHGTLEGLHLAYIASSARLPTRTIVYSDEAEPWVVREIQRLSGFYEHQTRLVFSLPSYINAELPLLDRRDPDRPDRRSSYRGGRRASDVPLLSVHP